MNYVNSEDTQAGDHNNWQSRNIIWDSILEERIWRVEQGIGYPEMDVIDSHQCSIQPNTRPLVVF